MADRSLFGKSTEARYLASNCHNRDSSGTASDESDEDSTATSKRKEFGDDVDVPDLEVLECLVDFHLMKGVFPFENREAMKSFLRPWLLLHIGNEYGWKMKLEHVKMKFENVSGPFTDQERKEFESWKKIWGNKGGGGDGGGGIGWGTKRGACHDMQYIWSTPPPNRNFPQEVDIEDLEVMERLLDFRSTKAVFPFEDPDAMKSFLRPWLLLHIGDEDGWKTKLEKVNNKFTKSSDPIGDGEREEFDLWMKIWGMIIMKKKVAVD
ncbi:hypothetical protein OSB04_015383 [Centaurea solstitialis]|uniref:Uncharacterized protein n=1 Tax=Centaurea solstitialis TaxID=347529 RepID=A0AA38SZ36_9ASTR|nr:hypothetical protein OSB04_015383 [Centaurea solstitialis]